MQEVAWRIVMPKKNPLFTYLFNPTYIAYGFVLIGAVVMLLPLWIMFVYATHTNSDILSTPPPFWFGSSLKENATDLFQRLPYFWNNFGMSVYVASITTILNLLFCSMAGYAFAKFEFKGKNLAFAIVMGTLLLPQFLGLIPSVIIMQGLGWLNEAKALYVPAACTAIGVFMMRQFISSSIPNELLDAARIDGCGELRIYFLIVVPLLGPAFGTLGLITFIGSWNNFLSPLVIMQDMERFTVPLALRSLNGMGEVPWGAITLGSALATLPLIIAFVFASKRFIEGMTAGAVKG